MYYESTHADASKGDITYEGHMERIGKVKYGIASLPKDLTHPITWTKTLGEVGLHSRHQEAGISPHGSF